MPLCTEYMKSPKVCDTVAKDNISATASHIRGYGDHVFPAGLGHYFRLFLVVLCVENRMFDALFFEHTAQLF